MARKVFIIVLCFNGVDLTLGCLDSIEKQDYPNLELCMVDNGSTDHTIPIVSEKFPHAQWIENQKNLGYALGNNRGIQYALGAGAEAIFLVNNDTRLHKTCVSNLMSTLQKNSQIGILGPMVYTWDADKTISSAGGMVDWQIAHTVNVGMGEKDIGQYPAGPVDFINGCGIMVTRETVQKAGVLDPKFFMYWEETDWCLRAKKAGFEIYFEPAAVMEHKAPILSVELSPTTLYYMTAESLSVFFTAHTQIIETHYDFESTERYLARHLGEPCGRETCSLKSNAIRSLSRGFRPLGTGNPTTLANQLSNGPMNILFLSRWFPFPPDNGSKLRVFNLIKIIASEHTVDLVSFSSEAVSEKRVEGLLPYCRNVKAFVYKDYNPKSFRSLLGFFSTKPRYIVDTYRKDCEQIVTQFAHQANYDMVISSQLDMVPYTKLVPGAKIFYDEIEVTMYSEARYTETKARQRLWSRFTWWKHRRYIAQILKRANGFSVVSDREMEILNQINRSDCRGEVIPNGIDMDYYQGNWGEPEPNTLIYAGALTYDVNLDAMKYFLSEIFPIIKKKKPSVKLSITGKVNDQIRAALPEDPNVEFTGYLDDVRPRIARAWISIIPLRIGGGTRLKVLESLALGTPVISTRKGAEGLELKTGRDLIIRDDPNEFALEVVNLLENRELRMSLGNSGKKTVGSLYNWKLIGERFLRLVAEI